ncbi:MAG: exodeoxyribonuclease VII small subunit [Bacteroidales bacterium]|nr:exodeoxyribonuclease VII small subunit [Bacteroidales bacterium]
MSKKSISYNEAVSQIEDILNRIENEELDVDELTKLVKEASGLIKYCKNRLYETESEIEKILSNLDNETGE